MGREARSEMSRHDAEAPIAAPRVQQPAAYRLRPAGLLGRLKARLQRVRGQPHQAPGGANTTAFGSLSASGRGQALRNAHRTLRRRLRSHPVLRKLMPHLWVLERALAREGSAALQILPVAVLQRCLQQLTLLQRDDETADEAQDLRTLRLRLIETVSDRAGGFDDDSANLPGDAPAAGVNRPAPVPGSCA